MTIAYFTFFAAIDTAPALSEERLADLGSRAWHQLEGMLSRQRAHLVQVREDGMEFEVSAYELCCDDVGLEQEADGTLSYGISLYSDQVGLTLTPERLQDAQRLGVQALQAAAVELGYPKASVRIVRVTRQRTLEIPESTHAASLEQLLQGQTDEAFWTVHRAGAAPALYFSRHKAFGALAERVQAFSQHGAFLREYVRKTSGQPAGAEGAHQAPSVLQAAAHYRLLD